MSLTSQLATGELGRWCAANLTGTDAVAADVTAAAANGGRPVRPARVDDSGHWAVIGGAFGQRLAFATQHAPPYYALLGAHRAGLTDWATLHRCAARFPTHTTLDAAARAARANQLRPLPGGGWLDLDQQPGDRYTGRATTGTRTALVVDVVERLVTYLATHAPPGRLAGSRGAEARLARACAVLTDWESAYRTGQLPAHTAALYTNPDTTVPDLLDAVPDHQVTELVELALRADRAGVLARLTGGLSGPVLVEHWADGDLLLPDLTTAGGGMALLDVKTVTSTRDPDRVGRWLWQLLGYAWLDPTDCYRMRTVGLYLARHGRLITWPLHTLATALLTRPGHPAGERDVDTAAGQFRRLAEHVITAETGHPAGLPRLLPPRR